MEKGIFVYGNYDWLGEYRATEILNALKQKYNEECDPLFAIDVFHSCYLLNTKMIDDPNEFIKQVAEQIISNDFVRKITVMDDLVSRVFAVEFIHKLLQQLPQQYKQQVQGSEDQQDSSSGSSDQGEQKDAVAEAIQEAVEHAKEKAEEAKLYSGLKAGVGHSVTFGELLNLNFAVDIKELLKFFTNISVTFEKARKPSFYGSREGIRFGRDLTKVVPSALSMPDELFWYRYATGTLPVIETYSTELSEFILVVDKSGSMDDENKTLWSRAVALALAKQAKKGNVRSYLMFFDYDVIPEKPIDLLKEFSKALDYILTLECDGGTSIDRALIEADKYGKTIILITDGEDSVSYKPNNKLITAMVEGENENLREISDVYLIVEPDTNGALRLLNVL